MDRHCGMERLAAAHRTLRSAMEKSRKVATALDRSGQRLQDISNHLPSLEKSLRPISAPREALAAMTAQIELAVNPSTAVLKVFDAVHGLEPVLLSDPGKDLSGYLQVFRRLEEALNFLKENCPLAIKWLEDMANQMELNSVSNGGFLAVLHGSILSLKSSCFALDGGLLNAALHRLEFEFRRRVEAAAPPDDLKIILDPLSSNGRLENCVKIFAEVRCSAVRSSFADMNLDCFDVEISDRDEAKSFEDSISRWRETLEFAVKNVLEEEYEQCFTVFSDSAAEMCFSDIAAQADITRFLGFALQVTNCNSDPFKLLKLLDIFSTLDRLRLNFNRLFGGKHHGKIRSTTRDLIRKVVDGTCSMFWELLFQVEWQRKNPPPEDAGVPKLISAIVTFCNTLLREDYFSVLAQVLQISHSWRREDFSPELLPKTIINVAGALEENLKSWSRRYRDPSQANLFLMNSYWHFHKHLQDTKLGNLLGEDRMQNHRHNGDRHQENFFRESWGKLPGFLLRNKLREFELEFEEMHRKHSLWIVPDEDLREEVLQTISNTLIPQYRSFLKRFRGDDDEARKKITSMEGMIFSLYHGRALSLIKSRLSLSTNGVVGNGIHDGRLQLPAPAVV